MTFFGELKRRNVFRVAIAYSLIAWVVLQILDVVVGVIDAPAWVLQLAFFIGIIGLVAVVIISWVYEMTPEGIKKESEIDRSQSVTPDTGRKLDRLIIAVLVVAVGILLADRFMAGGQAPTAEQTAEADIAPAMDDTVESTPESRSVAVLPFVNMSSDPEQEYFSDGISEEILNGLVKLADLKVAGRTSSFSFKGKDQDLRIIGEALGVNHILEGSVRKSGNQVRITAQLVQASDGFHLWSETYTRELNDIFAVQDEISQAIVQALQVTLSPEEAERLASRPTDNIEAYNKYLQGRQLWHGRGDQGLRRSVEVLEQAVTLDPDFALAWAALADSYVLLPEFALGEFDTRGLIAMARDASNRALELDPGLAQAYTTRAYLRFMYDFDWDNAEKDFLRAIELDPTYPTAFQWYGEFLAMRDRDIDKALAQIQIASRLDPLAPVMPHVSGWLTAQAHRFEEGIAYYQRALEIAPGFEASYGNLSRAYVEMGEFDAAHEAWTRMVQLTGDSSEFGFQLLEVVKDPTLKPAFLEGLANAPGLRHGPMDTPWVYMLLDEPELAMASLEKGLAEGAVYTPAVNRMAIYDELRDNPRFQAHLAEMNLWPPPEENE